MSRVASTPWLLEAIKRVEQTGEEAQRAIGEGLASIEGARQRLVAGMPVSEIVTDLMAQGGREARLRSSRANRDVRARRDDVPSRPDPSDG